MQHTNGYGSKLTKGKKNSYHSLIEKNTETIVFEPLRFILLLTAN